MMLRDEEIDHDKLYSRSYASILVILIERLVADAFEAMCRMQPGCEDKSIPEQRKADKLRMALLGYHYTALDFLLKKLGKEALKKESSRENKLYEMLLDDLAKLMFFSTDLSNTQKRALKRAIASTEAYSERIKAFEQRNACRALSIEFCSQSGIEDLRIRTMAEELFGSILTRYGPLIREHLRKYLDNPALVNGAALPEVERLLEFEKKEFETRGAEA